MKTIPFAITLSVMGALLMPAGASAQNTSADSDSTPTPPQMKNSSYVVVARGPHQRVWMKTATNALGQLAFQTNHAFTELKSGMHYWTNGAWQETRELIQPYPGGAVALQGPHKVIFANNLNTAGAIDLETPDGKRFTSDVLGLAYFDPASGRSVLLATVKDSQANILPPNQLVYTNAFNGLNANVVYTYAAGRFAQDIMLLESPPAPSTFGLGPKTRLQVMTEFLAIPESTNTLHVLGQTTNPVTRATMVEPDFVDQMFDFGAMRTGLGLAFWSGTPAAPQGPARVPVARQLSQINGRQVLLESVEWSAIQAQLAGLQPKVVSAKTPMRLAKATRELPARLPARTRGKNPAPILAAQAPITGGLVIDYELVESTDSYTFETDNTYVISGDVYIADATFEYNSIVKVCNQAVMYVTDSVGCTGPPIRWWVILTSVYDGVGEDTSGCDCSSGCSYLGYGCGTVSWRQKSYACPLFCYYLASSSEVGHMDIRHADVGVYCYYNQGDFSINNSVLWDCGVGVYAEGCSVSFGASDLYQVDYAYDAYEGSVSASNLTTGQADRDGNAISDYWELQYFDSWGVNAADDPDHDGLSYYWDYIFGLNPTAAPQTDSSNATKLQVYTLLK